MQRIKERWMIRSVVLFVLLFQVALPYFSAAQVGPNKIRVSENRPIFHR